MMTAWIRVAGAALLSLSPLNTVFADATAAKAEATSQAAQHAIGESTNASLQGDGKRALAALSAVPAEQFVGKDADYRACMLERFGRTSPPSLAPATEDAFLRELLSVYQSYWWQVLTAPSTREALDAKLQQRLQLLAGESGQARDWDALEARLTERLRDHGYHAQLGRTPPLRELMVWRKQDSKLYDVALPEGAHQVRVEMLDDFVSRGWSYYARCGQGSAGGWADKDRLYAVMPWFGANLDSDAFQASLLGHETQHFADMNRFADLQPWELEYRAKFAELWRAKETLLKLLARFASSQSDDKDAPHTYANKQVLSALRTRLKTQGITSSQADLSDVPVELLRAAAREQLLEDSRTRRAEQVTTIK